MSQRLKEWAMQQPEFRDFEREIEFGPYDGPRGSLASLESQLPRSRQLRKKLRHERNRD